MREFSKIIIMIIAVFVIINSFAQLTNLNRIFADSRQDCCDMGQCYTDECTAWAGMWAGVPHPTKPNVWFDCINYSDLTCYDCLDYEVSNCLCNQLHLNHWCLDTDNSPYYGQQVVCPAQK